MLKSVDKIQHAHLVAYMKSRFRHIRDGEPGTDETLRQLGQLIVDSQKRPKIRILATHILSQNAVPQKNDAAAALALFGWIKKNIRYQKDPTHVEVVQDPEITAFQIRAGDCDDQAALMGALASSVGIPARLTVIGNNRNNFSHIFAEVLVNNRWIAADTTLDAPFGTRPILPIKKTYSLNGVPNMYTPALSGYRRRSGMGIAPVIAAPAVTALTKATTNILNTLNPFGQSQGFKLREAASKDFFDKRNYIFSILSSLTPAQQQKWSTMSFLKTDYNTRRENDYERQELNDFYAWLQADIDNNARLQAEAGSGIYTQSNDVITAATSGSGMMIMAIMGLAALFLTRKK